MGSGRCVVGVVGVFHCRQLGFVRPQLLRCAASRRRGTRSKDGVLSRFSFDDSGHRSSTTVFWCRSIASSLLGLNGAVNVEEEARGDREDQCDDDSNDGGGREPGFLLIDGVAWLSGDDGPSTGISTAPSTVSTAAASPWS